MAHTGTAEAMAFAMKLERSKAPRRKPIMLDFELPIKWRTGNVKACKPDTVYFVRSVLMMLCPCGCGVVLHIPVKGPGEHTATWDYFDGDRRIWERAKRKLTITPWIYVPTCKTRFIIAHNTVYGQGLFPPRETANEPRKEIFLKFGKGK
jgi:hypothetical protein